MKRLPYEREPRNREEIYKKGKHLAEGAFLLLSAGNEKGQSITELYHFCCRYRKGHSMKRVNRRTFSGSVCEQEVFTVSERTKDVRHAHPKHPRFQTEEERIRHREAISQRNHARLVNENFGPESLYSTLTFDQDNEVHDFIDCKKLRDLYVRRLRRSYPDAVIFIYIGQGKTTHRFHLHMLSEGIPEEAIIEKWGFGEIRRIEHLREHNYYNGVDHGRDYTALANYLFAHWTPEQGGHHWKQTRNARKPVREAAAPAKRVYSEEKPPVAPKGYVLVEKRSTQYGYQYFKYVKTPEKDQKPRMRRQC